MKWIDLRYMHNVNSRFEIHAEDKFIKLDEWMDMRVGREEDAARSNTDLGNPMDGGAMWPLWAS